MHRSSSGQQQLRARAHSFTAYAEELNSGNREKCALAVASYFSRISSASAKNDAASTAVSHRESSEVRTASRRSIGSKASRFFCFRERGACVYYDG